MQLCSCETRFLVLVKNDAALLFCNLWFHEFAQHLKRFRSEAKMLLNTHCTQFSEHERQTQFDLDFQNPTGPWGFEKS